VRYAAKPPNILTFPLHRKVRRVSFVSAYLGRMKARHVLVAAAATVLASATIAVPVLALPGERTHASKPDETNGKVKVRVMDNFFDPRSVGVAQDQKVVFLWKGSNRHNVRFTKVPKGASRKGSKTRRTGRFTRSFDKPGLYRYVCTLFSGMRGTITVKPPTAGEG
jgi:plastocyanin